MAVAPGDLGHFLKGHRVAAGLTQEELAEQAGISTRTISDVERGLRATIYRDTAGRLAAALRLGDMERAQFEALARGTASTRTEFPLGQSLATGSAPAPIPKQLTRLVGRERELIVVVGALKDPARRLVTLTGAGGIGKSRLAMEAAEMAKADFADGVFFVPLAAVRDPSHVTSAILGALGITRAQEPLADALAAHLDTKRCLLVLDTFEQILEAAPFVGDLLARCPNLNILVTSRERLHLRAEHELPVPALSLPPDAAVTAEQLTWYAATVLFVERARSHQPDLAINDDEAQLIADICRQLDGLPLAIELAAARLKHLPLAALREHLEHALQVLTGGPRDLPLRQQTMRDTIAWSYELLQSAEQILFRRLAVFADGWTLESARSICIPETDLAATLDAISGLVDKSLAFLRPAPSDTARYGMLDVIRDYAAERLRERRETDDVLRRHAAHFLEMAERAEREFGRAGQETWFDRIDIEHQNFRTALHWAIQERNVDVALRLGGALWQFWRSHGDYAEGRMWLRGALGIEGHATPDIRAKAVWGAAALAYHHGDYTDLRRLSEEFQPLAQRASDPVHLRNALTIQGVVAMTQQRFGAAVGRLREALAISRSVGTNWLLGTSHMNLGGALMHSGDLAGARSNFEEALETYRNIGDRNFAARAIQQLGYLALHTGERQQARSRFTSALETFRDLQDRWGVAEALEGFSALSAADGMAWRAATLSGAAERLRELFGARTLPADRVSIDRFLVASRGSVDEDLWQRAWEEGREMSIEQAIDIALSDPSEGGEGDSGH